MKKLIATMAATSLLVAAVAIQIKPSFSEDITPDSIQPAVEAFNVLSAHLEETRVLPTNRSPKDIKRTRDQVCKHISGEGDMVHSIVSTADNSLKGLTEDDDRKIRQTARDGDSFLHYMMQEEKGIADEYGDKMRDSSKRFLRQMAIDWRPSIVDIKRDYFRLDPSEARNRLKLLCAPEHSPVHNESHAGWWSWATAAVQFVGGLVMVGADIAIPALQPISPMSTRIGIGATRHGGWALYTLFRDVRGTEDGGDD